MPTGLELADRCGLLKLSGRYGIERRILWIAVMWWFVVLAYGYTLWIAKGCTIYMPFISDMGLQAHIPRLFTLGSVIEGLLLSFFLLWSTIARHQILKLLRLRFFVLEVLCALTGIMAVSGTFFIGFFPWDVYTLLHFACAINVFWGGCFYSFFTCLLCHGIHSEVSVSLGFVHSMYNWLTPLCGFCFFGVFACLFAALDARPDFFTWTWWSTLQALAREDFLAYCSSESWHGLPWVNSCAFFEWLTLGLLCVSMFAGQADIQLFLDLKEGKKTLPERGVGSEEPSEGVVSTSVRCSSWRWWLLLVISAPSLCIVLYITWLLNGCSMFPPFLSHFGLAPQTRWLHSTGFLLIDGILAVWLLHLFNIKRALAKAEARRGVDVLLLAGFNAAGGILMVVGLAAASIFPWDAHFSVHLLGLICLVIGFGLWSVAMIIISMHDWLATRPTPWWFRPLRFLQYCSWFGSLSALAMGGSGFSFHLLQSMVLGDWTRLGIGRGFVAENFRDVCGSEGLTETVTVPPATWTNFYALCQWMWLACMHCFVSCSICDSQVGIVQKDGRLLWPLTPKQSLLVGIFAAGLLHLR